MSKYNIKHGYILAYNTIKKWNKYGYNFPFPKSWKFYFKEALKKDFTNFPSKTFDNNETNENFINKYQLKIYLRNYYNYLNEFLKKAFSKIDYEKIKKKCLWDSANDFCHTLEYRKMPFSLFIKDNIWKVDLNKSTNEILFELLLKWNDLDEDTYEIYHRLSYFIIKKYNAKQFYSKHFIENYMDIDLGWNSDEEWVMPSNIN